MNLHELRALAVREPARAAADLKASLADGRITLADRVDLVGEQIRLPWPYALEVDPDDLEIFRTFADRITTSARGWRVSAAGLSVLCGLWCLAFGLGVGALSTSRHGAFLLIALTMGGIQAAFAFLGSLLPMWMAATWLDWVARLGWFAPLLGALCCGIGEFEPVWVVMLGAPTLALSVVCHSPARR